MCFFSPLLAPIFCKTSFLGRIIVAHSVNASLQFAFCSFFALGSSVNKQPLLFTSLGDWESLQSKGIENIIFPPPLSWKEKPPEKPAGHSDCRNLSSHEARNSRGMKWCIGGPRIQVAAGGGVSQRDDFSKSCWRCIMQLLLSALRGKISLSCHKWLM